MAIAHFARAHTPERLVVLGSGHRLAPRVQEFDSRGDTSGRRDGGQLTP